jgi:hypothetical protein
MSEREELKAWAEKYQDVPWVALNLATAAAGDPSGFEIMRRLYALVEEQKRLMVEACDVIEGLVAQQAMPDGFWREPYRRLLSATENTGGLDD